MDNMGYRNITVTDETYEKLKGAKKEKESFNTLLDRLVSEKPRSSLRDCQGAWADMTDEEEKEFWKSIKSTWGRWNERIGYRPASRKPAKRTGRR